MESTNALGVPRQHEPATIVDIKVSTGDSVAKQAPLLVYEHKVKYDPASAESQDRDLLKALNKSVDSDGYVSKREFLRTPFEGSVASLSCAIGDVVRHGDVLVEITVPCGHGAVFNGLCGLCGKDVSGIDTSGLPNSHANIDMFHDATGLKVSYEVAANIDADTRNSLWDQKKLSLIIDLDQTIIHANATLDPHFEDWLIDNYDGPQINSKGKEKEASEDEPAPAPRLPLDVGSFYLSDSPLRYFIKMRPGLQDFLERISQLYEMHIYTMGTKPYANAVAAMIDPERRYFNGRILSRDESGSMTRKTLKRLFPVDTSMVVILDDRADVWEWSPNLIKVHPYEFFRGVGDINAGMLPNVQRTEPAPSTGADSADVAKPDGVSDSTGNHPLDSNDPVVQAERSAAVDGRNTQPSTPGEKRPLLVDADRELVTIQSVLTNLHQKYYNVLDDLPSSDLPDVAQLLASKRRQVLSGVTIVFTAAFPINQGAPPPHKNDLWQWAQSFGARCELEINERTTHVVAGKPGTEKVHSARRMRGNNGANTGGRSPPIVVKTNWLLDSIGRWESLDETPYLWYDEDKDVVIRSRKHLSTQSNASNSPSLKRKENDSVFPDRDSKQPRRQLAAIQRLKGQQEASGNFDSANTTDIEDELERQEAGLEEHEAEVDDFVQTIDWDDLEREAMEDSESDYASDHSQPSSPGAGNSKTQSRAGTSPSLRNAALLQATQKQQQKQQQASRNRQSRSGTGGDVLTDSSDVYADSSSECSSGGEDQEAGAQTLAERHRMKRRKTSPDSTKQRREAASRRRSKLAEQDGSLDIGTNTEGTEDSEADVDDSSEQKLAAKTGDVRKRLANKLGISLKPSSSILDRDNDSRANNSDSDDDSDRYAGRSRPDAPLFAGIEDPPVVGFENDKDGDSEFEDAGSQQGIPGEGEDDDAGSGESDQWGEDDDDDDENFDDLINNLEEEISST
ncbi:CTD phosphatase Fcp1 [Coemansia aciculifera]|uniref:RNA polymerase II subunit A C-terminal domain phosphatase n=1 Tax=Coemansia aciculifera TaxID=417176 RepID=A0A9W8ITD3_9FUNG|nr:CTD phosphatase Fcp1 [Coemansia aciculifera]